MNIFEELYPTFKLDKNKKVRLITLFSGYDSQALAFKYLDKEIEHYKAVEFNKFALQSLNEIHNTKFKVLDIKSVNGNDLNIVDKSKYQYIMTYSFPCTDLSIAGKMQGMEEGSNTRSSLLWEVKRLLNETEELPDVLIMENVPQVLTAKGWYQWNVFLEKKGYSNYTQVLDAQNFGIPQHRERVFMVSILGDYNYSFPKKIKLESKLKDFLENEVDDKYFLSAKMIEGMKNTKFSSYQYNNNNMTDKKIIKTLTTSSGERAPLFIKVKDKGNYFEWQEKGKLDKDCRCYKENCIASTITTTNVGKTLLKDLRIRRLTPKECFRLMGVKPSDYSKITCSDTQKYKQAGNSIVTTCLMAIYSQLYENCDYTYYIKRLVNDLQEKEL